MLVIRFKGIQKLWKRKDEFEYPSNIQYMMENIDRFLKEDFIPNESDVLRLRQRTTGIVETKFNVQFLSTFSQILSIKTTV